MLPTVKSRRRKKTDATDFSKLHPSIQNKIIWLGVDIVALGLARNELSLLITYLMEHTEGFNRRPWSPAEVRDSLRELKAAERKADSTEVKNLIASTFQTIQKIKKNDPQLLKQSAAMLRKNFEAISNKLARSKDIRAQLANSKPNQVDVRHEYRTVAEAEQALQSVQKKYDDLRKDLKVLSELVPNIKTDNKNSRALLAKNLISMSESMKGPWAGIVKRLNELK